MILSAYNITSDKVAIPYEWRSALLCGDDAKVLIISPSPLCSIIDDLEGLESYFSLIGQSGPL